MHAKLLLLLFLMILLLFFILKNMKEEIQKKTGYIVMRADGVYDVDANTAIDQLSEDLNIKMPEVEYFYFMFKIL